MGGCRKPERWEMDSKYSAKNEGQVGYVLALYGKIRGLNFDTIN